MTSHSSDFENRAAGNTRRLPHAVVDEILTAVGSIRYGSVEITVHDGKVLQIERKEKLRLSQDQSTKRS